MCKSKERSKYFSLSWDLLLEDYLYANKKSGLYSIVLWKEITHFLHDVSYHRKETLDSLREAGHGGSNL